MWFDCKVQSYSIIVKKKSYKRLDNTTYIS